ncbi:Uncharacterized protein TCAP_02860 [Tolypocladium capitatum]|uniref:Uncharacterized protein n=1 Tax=Tolypocladium capitatum TaxID=45235 RepID=A0A2K3QI47_9HYPO|nr:Uncharacterized protein TCAP_02860 [Tolypocladium capitatum]
MKIAAVLAFASLACAADVGALLNSIKPLLKQVKCAVPCVASGIRQIPCDGGNPLDSICSNVDKIEKNSMQCLQNCHLKSSQVDSITTLVKTACGKGRGRLARRQDTNSCSNCETDCQKAGCTDDDDCALCAAACDLICT